MNYIEFILIHKPEQIKKAAAAAKEIWNEYFPPLISQGKTDYMVKNFQSEEAISDSIKKGYEYYFIMLENNIIGYFAVFEKIECLFISKLYLYKEQRGNGYASKVIKFIEKLALERGKKSVYLYVYKGNENSVAVYKNWNFKITREVDTDIGGGYVLNDFEMEKLLI